MPPTTKSIHPICRWPGCGREGRGTYALCSRCRMRAVGSLKVDPNQYTTEQLVAMWAERQAKAAARLTGGAAAPYVDPSVVAPQSARVRPPLLLDADAGKDPALCRLAGCTSVRKARGLCAGDLERVRDAGLLDTLALPVGAKAAPRKPSSPLEALIIDDPYPERVAAIPATITPKFDGAKLAIDTLHREQREMHDKIAAALWYGDGPRPPLMAHLDQLLEDYVRLRALDQERMILMSTIRVAMTTDEWEALRDLDIPAQRAAVIAWIEARGRLTTVLAEMTAAAARYKNLDIMVAARDAMLDSAAGALRDAGIDVDGTSILDGIVALTRQRDAAVAPVAKAAPAVPASGDVVLNRREVQALGVALDGALAASSFSSGQDRFAGIIRVILGLPAGGGS